MKNRLLVIARNREVLLIKIENQRLALADITLRWKTPLAVIDGGMKAVRFMHNHPALVSGSMTAILAWRRTSIAGLALEAWKLLRRYPSALTLGLQYLSLKSRAPSAENDTESD